MSSYVKAYIKPNCEKSIKALDMVMEYGGVYEVVVVGDIHEASVKAFGEKMAEYTGTQEISYISEDAEELQRDFYGEPLPQIMFDSFPIGYEKLCEAYESGDLDGYFT